MSTTVCSSECTRYESLKVAVTLSYFAVFSYYMYWLIYSGTHLNILVSFLLITVAFACLLHISSLGFAVVYFAFACAPYSNFFGGFVVAFQVFFYKALRHSVVYFLYFSSSNIICYP